MSYFVKDATKISFFTRSITQQFPQLVEQTKEQIEMANLNIKLLKEKVSKMLAAWLEGAPDVIFMGIARKDLDTKCKQAEALENEIADLEAQKKLKEDQLADVYLEMNEMTVDVRNGVSGDKAFGDDSALYGAMGYVRKSERKSGLTRKVKVKEEFVSV